MLFDKTIIKTEFWEVFKNNHIQNLITQNIDKLFWVQYVKTQISGKIYIEGVVGK